MIPNPRFTVFFSVDYGSHPQHWLLFDRIVQQIVLQSEGNDTGVTRNPDVAPIEINVKEIVHLLAKEEELVAARKKAEELERENSDMSTRLAKKEQELDLRTQEKVIIARCLAQIEMVVHRSSSHRSIPHFLGRHRGQLGEGERTARERDVDAHRDQAEDLGITRQSRDPVTADKQRKIREEEVGAIGSLWQFTGRCQSDH